MTVPGLGRDVALVARTAEGTGLAIMFATGYYTYDNLPFPFGFRGPGKLLDGDDRVLESMFEKDLTSGIADTGIRAAVVKAVTDEHGLTPDVERLVTAVARVSARTGAPVCTHAHAPTQRGLDQIRIFAEHGVDMGRVMIGHSNETSDLSYFEKIIDAGCYVGWDRCGLSVTLPLEDQLDTLAALCAKGYAGRLMLSHDKACFMDWFRNEEVDAVQPDWNYGYIHSGVLPGMRSRGVTEEQIEKILVANPRQFFARATSAAAAAPGRAVQLSGLDREPNPFDSSGVVADGDGVRRYQDLPASLVAMLDASVRAAPQAEALVEVGGDRISYRQMWDRAARVAGGLREAGVSPGDRVAIRLPNSIDWMLAFAGIQLAGAIAVPVNTRFTDAEAAYVMDDSGSGVRLEPGSPLPDGPPFVYEGAGLKDVAAIFYTSGTTGFPKGAMHTHENVLANVETAFRVCGIPRDYRRGPAHAGRGAAVPRHRVPQPGAGRAARRRGGGDRLGVRRRADDRHAGPRADLGLHRGAGDLLLHPEPPVVRPVADVGGALGVVRRRADRAGAGGADRGELPLEPGGQRLRADRIDLDRHVPAARVGGGARRLGRVRGAAHRGGDRGRGSGHRDRARS